MIQPVPRIQRVIEKENRDDDCEPWRHFDEPEQAEIARFAPRRGCDHHGNQKEPENQERRSGNHQIDQQAAEPSVDSMSQGPASFDEREYDKERDQDRCTDAVQDGISRHSLLVQFLLPRGAFQMERAVLIHARIVRGAVFFCKDVR